MYELKLYVHLYRSVYAHAQPRAHVHILADHVTLSIS